MCSAVHYTYSQVLLNKDILVGIVNEDNIMSSLFSELVLVEYH